jgi:xylulokinase
VASFVGVDVGTSGARALVVREDGALLGAAATSYPLATPAAGFAEQDPDDWVRGAEAAIRGALAQAGGAAGEVRGLGLTGQMHSAVFLDGDGRVLRPAILWCDQRTARECDELTAAAGGRAGLIDKTLNVALPGFTAPKLLWLRRHEAALAARVRTLLVGKDYVRFQLTGERVTDVSDASGTLLFDVRERRWSPAMLAALAIDPALLPRCVESRAVAGGLTADAARRLGLKPGLPVVGGAGDQAASALGCGVVAPGVFSISLGTSGVVFAACAEPLVDPEGTLHSFCHAAPATWHAMGVMLSAGGAVNWFRRFVRGDAGDVTYAQLDAEAARAPHGSDGLLFLPYLTGERTPVNDPDARGAFVGLTVRHGRGHAMRAVMEGVAYGLRASFELLAARGLPAREVRITGGGARSRLFCEIVASALERDLVRLAADEGPAFGAAMLAASGVGGTPLAELAARWVRVVDTVAADRASATIHRDGFARTRATYLALRATSRPG